ncbi:MAG: MoaD/ThiS family protein [Desulfobacter sp.]|nr:MoaD/ThiS family protein [Desulfobacter sp.]WDP85038.1 MAG: MoaD/ThiS family protein [Desulfobacter sp.]
MIQVDDKPMDWQEGMTITQLLAEVENSIFVSVVRVNGRLISSPRFDHTRIEDGSIVQLLPLIAGG